MRRGARPVPERDGQLRARVPAGRDVPGKGRHVHQRRTPDQPRAQGDGAARRLGGLGGDAGDLQRHGLRDALHASVGDHGRDRAHHADVSPACPTRSWTQGSVQWPCNDAAPEGTPIMHMGGFVRGKGNFVITEYVPTDEKVGPRFPLLLTTGRILSQYNVGAQTRRTANVVWHRGGCAGDPSARRRGTRRQGRRLGAAAQPRRARRRCARAVTERVAPGVVYTTFHHPTTQANVVTTRVFRLGDELSGIQGDRGAGDAVQRAERVAGRIPRADRRRAAGSRRCRRSELRATAFMMRRPLPSPASGRAGSPAQRGGRAGRAPPSQAASRSLIAAARRAACARSRKRPRSR